MGSHPKQTWSMRSSSRFIALTASLALVFTVIYYGVFFETEGDTLEIRKPYRHQPFPSEVLYSLMDSNSIQQIPETTPSFVSSSTYKPPPLRALKKGSWRRFFRVLRRKRSAPMDDQLDPLESDFRDLTAKIRDRRTKVELSKLEKEYAKCKKESMKRSECMETFQKMYKIAKEISEKMEKMKEIFRDSEMHMNQTSMSSSMEHVDETVTKKAETKALNATTQATTVDEFYFKGTTDSPIENYHPSHGNKSVTKSSFSLTPDITTESRSTLNASTEGFHLKRLDFLDFGDVTEPLTTDDGKSTSLASIGTTAALTDVTSELRSTAPYELNATTASQRLTDVTFEVRSTTPVVSNTTTASQRLTDVTSELRSTAPYELNATTASQRLTDVTFEVRSTTPVVSNSTTASQRLTDVTSPTPLELNASTEGFQNGVESTVTTEVTGVDGDTTMDWGDIATVSSTTQPVNALNATTAIHGHGERSSGGKGLTLTNHTTDVKITYHGKCGATNFEYKTPTDCPLTKQEVVTEGPVHTNGTTPFPKKNDYPERNEDHPLDFPSSKENMLDDKLPMPVSLTEENWEEIFKSGAISAQPELMDSFGDLDHANIGKFGPKMNPSKNPSAAHNPQLITLCEHLARQFRNKAAQEKDDSMTSTPSTHFTSRGPGFPVTGETMKASAQFLINPNFGVPSIPVCFYITPASFRMMMQPFWSPFFGMQGLGGMGGMGSGSGGSSAGASTSGGIFIIPPTYGSNMHSNGNFFGHSSPSGSGSQSSIANIFSKSATSPQSQEQKQQQFFCTYMQDVGKHTPSGGFSNVNFKLRSTPGNESSPIDIVYSSYWNKSPGFYGTNLGQKDRSQCPLEGDVPCYGGGECVPEKKWCDSTVDCSDGSDEAACTCRDRISEQRICDGYQDCPLGEDEIGCFGCGRTMYSCYDNSEEFEMANRSTLAMCYSSAERCDGAKNCINGRDETGCNLIVSDLTHHMSHAVSSSVGYLYRNHQGVWYPVCNNAQRWAREACTEELGHLTGEPMVTFQEVQLPGPFIEPHHVGDAHFPQSCQKRERDTLSDHAAHVRCPLPKCGFPQESTSPLLRSRRRRRRRDAMEKDRIVGGLYSKPLQWPFIVAIYRNGEFHCGGTIFSEQWVITAAHCTLGFRKYYYEVRAGMLRRSSFASATQIHHVTHVVVHQEYDRRTMRNDIALLRIESPLRYNRWVKPICLPDEGRTTAGADWIWGPEVDTVCTVIGWGAIREKGPGSDPLREVQLPIRKKCVEKDDQDAEDICAGELVGGRDACQGDSGGPLLCRSVSNDKEWYLAGVVSHGNGCARAKEFGAYTRVALYLDWIEMAMKPEFLPKAQPLHLCPGYECIWGGKRCISEAKRCDRLVDCLGGEDEVGCIYNFIPDVGAAANASTTPLAGESESTAQEEATTTDSGFNPNAARGGGADTEPLSLETDDSKLFTMDTDTTETPNSELKALMAEWLEEDDRTMAPSSTTVSTLTTAWSSPEPVTDEATSSSTALPTSTAEVTKLQDLAVKFLDTIDKETTTDGPATETTTDGPATETTTDGTTTETTPLATSTESVGTTQTTDGSSGFEADFKETPDPNQKRENATEGGTTTVAPKTMPKSIFQKFVCKKIPQIIDVTNHCDRISDCEDGTDEEGCTCEQYLKGPLRILVCDGKADCDDLTDEDNCGNCTATEFLCPMSKTCIDMTKRCDNSVDCPFKEDEKDCFALTDGKEIRLDGNKQPILHHSGIFSRNTNGVWRVVCSYETGFDTSGAKTADDTCSLLGFKGFRFYNTTKITQHTIVPIEPDFVQAYPIDRFPVGDSVHFTEGIKHMSHYRIASSSSRKEAIEKVPEHCLGVFVECVPRTKESAPIKTFAAGLEISPKHFHMHGHQPNFLEIFAEKKDEILDKLNKFMENKTTVLVHDKLHEGVEKWHWPWLVDVYANGVLWCVGVLVDKHWVMVHESCYNGVRLDLDYVTVLLGGGKSKDTQHKSPHEQIKRVDCFEAVESSNILLLHLDYAAHFTRHVLPTFLPDISLTETGGTADKPKLECMSVVHDKFGGIRVTPTESGQQPRDNASDTVCGGDIELSCYQWNPTAIVDFKARHMGERAGEEMVAAAGSDAEEVKSLSDFCSNLDSSTSYPHNQGVIVCREDNAGWYPKAFYTYNTSECNNLKKPFPVRTLERYYGPIQDIIDEPRCRDSYPRPHCETLRCPLGNCLLPEQLCDGKVDCHDGSDEEKEFCRLHNNECRTSELKCRSNGKCVPKNKFCDHIADCEDLTDEPTICSCFTYLQATDPGKICDGIRNCWDKSDESSVLCNCTADRFPCGSSPSECIPKDFVCDKEPDCPNGEDEQFCYGIEHPITSQSTSSDLTQSFERPPSLPVGYGQVIEQTYGVWHTKCFPRKRPPNSTEVAEICRKLGYHVTRQPSYRLIDDSLDIVAAAEIQDGSSETMGKYRDPTKAVVINKFSPLHLNDDLTLILKPSRPITELAKWNETDSNNCYRLEVKCA